MKREKWIQVMALLICFLILFALPFLGEIYYKPFYYIGIILSMPFVFHKIIWDEKHEKRFYIKWHKAREKGFKINVAREGIKGFVISIIVVMINQFFGRGLTPIDIVHKLPNSLISWLILFLLVLGLVIGVVSWHEKEKRYCRIHSEVKE